MMKKEPITLYIFRFLMGFGLFAFMFMLYWSSLLVEENLRGLRTDLNQLRSEIRNFRFMNGVVQQSEREKEAQRLHIDPSLPDLLEEDPFYTDTLPGLLPNNFIPHGTLFGATVGKPDDLHPFSNWSQVNSWNSLCNVSLSRLKFGIYETFSPDMAIKIEKRTNNEFWVHLRDGVYWRPLQKEWFSEDINFAPQFLEKHQVTAHDYKFYFDALMNPNNQEAGAVASRTYLEDIDAIEVVDDLTFVVRWKTHDVVQDDGSMVPKIKYVARQLTGSLSPLASFVYKYFPDGTTIVEDDSDPNTYRTHSVWAQNFMQHWARNIIISCGTWIFDGMSDQQVKFRRNPDHYFPYDALVNRLETTFKNTPDAIWQDFKANRLPTHVLQPDQLVEYDEFLKSDFYKEQESAIKRLDYLARTYYYIGWNQATPFFKSKKVRRAMTMAIDRERLINQNLNGMGIEITGGFFRNSPAYNTAIEPWPYNPRLALRMLREDGWYDSDGDGILDKEVDGQRVPFRFTLTYYVKNPTTKAICEYVGTALKEIGIDCQLNGVDIADLSAAFEEKSFDAISLGWGLGTPPEDPNQLWHSSGAKERGSSNAVGFANPEADRIIENLHYEDNQQKRIKLYHKFHEILHEEQPYTFLYTPKVAFIYRDYLQNVFIPAERQDLIPGANIAQPSSSIFWIKE